MDSFFWLLSSNGSPFGSGSGSGYGYGVVVLSSLLFLSVSSLLLSILHFYLWRPSSLRRLLVQQNLPVLPYTPFVGSLPYSKRLEALAQQSDLPSPSLHSLLLPHVLPFHHKFFSHFAADTFVFWSGTQPTLLAGNPDDVKTLLSADVKHFRKPRASANAFRRLLGHGLLEANGEDWHNQRNILRPAFFADKLKEMVADMSTSGLEMVRSWEKQIETQGGNSAEVEVANDIKNATADIIAHTSFGSSYEKGKTVFENQVLLLHLLSNLRVWNVLIPGYSFLPTAQNRECMRLERSINEDLRNIVESRRKSGSHGDALSYGRDLLGLMLAAEDQELKHNSSGKRLTTEEVIGECKTFFFAGHETTANLLSWTMVLLALNQDWQEQARQEVLEICGKEEEPKADQLNKLKIIGMILNESLRLYPPVPAFGHRVSIPNQGSFKLGDRVLPSGTGFTIPALYIHRRKDLWGDDADEFRPERFSNGISKACKHPYAFLPFGSGPRICIGQTFALMEAKVIMALILQRFKFELSPNYRHAPVISVTMRPKHGVQLILHSL